MRFVRLAALVGSLVLLVATAVSVVNRRGDLRTEQIAAVEQSNALAAFTVESTLAQVRQNIDLVGLAVERNGAVDDIEFARRLAGLVDDAEACVGVSVAGCTGTDLFSLTSVNDLAVRSESSDGSQTLVAVDRSTNSVIAVQRISSSGASSTIAMWVPLDSLRAVPSDSANSKPDVSIELSAGVGSDDPASMGPTTVDGRRIYSEAVMAPFVDGALKVSSSTPADVGIVGDQPLRYGLQFLLGTVLLALAGWTFLVERRHLERRATTDELTGLINRREFERVSDIALDSAEREGAGLCVMVIDLNGFKQVNDTLGHQFGDLVLAASSERLVAAVRDSDVVGRWGGDEFVILLPTLAERSAVRTSAERIWHSLADHPVVGDTHMTASIGAAIYPRHGTTLDALMRAADVAMYEAKTTGVSHRIADTIATSESMLADDTGPLQVIEVITDEYAGPDRRHSPVPPPMRPPGELRRPTVPEVPLRDASSSDRAAADEAHIR